MFTNYLKIAFFERRKQKGLASINILGLSLGVATFIIFLPYSINELHYSHFHTDS
jgi:putative ABC transport system permease protein